MEAPEFFQRQSSESSIASNDSLNEYLPEGCVLELSKACKNIEDLFTLIGNVPSFAETNNSRSEQVFDPIVDDDPVIWEFDYNTDESVGNNSALEFIPLNNQSFAISDQILFSPTLAPVVEQNPFQNGPPSPPSVQIQQTSSIYAKDDLYQSPPNSPPSPVNGNIHDWLVTDETSRRKRRPYLYEFLRHLLDNAKYSHIAEYVDVQRGIFKLRSPKEVAALWKFVKGRNSDIKMTYDKLARAIRYYYPSGIIHSSPGRFTFRFGDKSGFGITWRPAQM